MIILLLIFSIWDFKPENKIKSYSIIFLIDQPKKNIFGVLVSVSWLYSIYPIAFRSQLIFNHPYISFPLKVEIEKNRALQTQILSKTKEGSYTPMLPATLENFPIVVYWMI